MMNGRRSSLQTDASPAAVAADPRLLDITVVLPAMNEAGNLELILPKLHETLRRQGLRYELLVVDGGSQDDTAARAESHGARVHRQIERGYGSALKEAFALARGRHILTMDADYSHDPTFVADLWRARSMGAVVVASRYIKGGRSDAGRFRSTLSRILNFVFRRVISLPVYDLSSGFRLYDRLALSEVEITSRNFDALEEILIKIYGLGYKIAEIPFHYKARAEGVSKARIIKFGWQLAKTLFRLWKLRNAAAWADYDYRAYNSQVFLQRYWQRTRHRLIMEMIGTPALTLDIGCGSSRIVQDIPRCIGADVQKNKLRFQAGHGVPAIGASVFALPFKDASFDGLIFSQVIEHIPLKPQCMGEIRRVMKPGGTLIIGTPDYGRLFWVVLEEFYDRVAPAAYGHEHITHFTMKSFRHLIDGAGFRCVRARYVGGGELIIKAIKE